MMYQQSASNLISLHASFHSVCPQIFRDIALLRTFLIKRHFAFKYMEEGNKEVHFKDLIHTAKSVEFKSL